MTLTTEELEAKKCWKHRRVELARLEEQELRMVPYAFTVGWCILLAGIILIFCGLR